jgi:WhiB family redox-sensing transcriptional regulator
MNYPDFYVKGPTPCSTKDPEQFFADSEEPGSIKTTNKAKKVCIGCPYIEECLAWALDNNEYGVWGGTTKNERRRLKRAIRVPNPVVRD